MAKEIAIQYGVASKRGIPSAEGLRAFARAALPKRHGELTIRIVDEAESRAFNRDYRGKDKPTNVLSFGGDAEPASKKILGDLVICAPVVAREAIEQGKTSRAHWAHMVVHGCLHLQGYDHEVEADAERMEAREIRILKSLGFPDPYGDG
ncbi:rRNA maturation RNase YbeY [Solimonas soli]|uniref:rRNA maturation RNase YbeY n=1 Tax=Solimonas soli TaxID=413479 RepID=UPI0004898E66|nr:rRNA maturation RNase YbeY [Solimonas soli]